MPGELRSNIPPIPDVRHPADQTDLVGGDSRAGAYQAQAIPTALAEQDPELVERLGLPAELRDLVREPGAGGGVTGPTGHLATLTAEEIHGELSRLPEWWR
jgi:hypothetical protein